VFAALVMLVPFLGPVLAIAPPALIALLVYPDRVWWILLILIALQLAVLNVVSPRVMSQTVGMHPLLVVAAVLVGAKVAGPWCATRTRCRAHTNSEEGQMRVRKAVIPAAGLGTRFLPASKVVPKEMLPVVDRPVIQYVVEEAVAAGIEQIIIVTAQSKRAVEDHFDTHFELESRLEAAGKQRELDEVRRLTNLAEFIFVRQ